MILMASARTWVRCQAICGTSPQGHLDDVAVQGRYQSCVCNEERGGGGNQDSYWFYGASTAAYNLDQNTLDNTTPWNFNATSRIAETTSEFAGLCLQCHPKSALNPDTGKDNTWRSMNRVHNTVKGWGGYNRNADNAIHSYTCSKCHSPHNSNLARLMSTNCLISHTGPER